MKCDMVQRLLDAELFETGMSGARGARAAQAVRAHLESCARCRAAWQEMTRLASALERAAAAQRAVPGATEPDAPAGAGFVERVMSAIRSGSVCAPARRRAGAQRVALSLAGLLAGVALVLVPAIVGAALDIGWVVRALKAAAGLAEAVRAAGSVLGAAVPDFIRVSLAVFSALLGVSPGLVLGSVLAALATGLALAHLLSGRVDAHTASTT